LVKGNRLVNPTAPGHLGERVSRHVAGTLDLLCASAATERVQDA